MLPGDFAALKAVIHAGVGLVSPPNFTDALEHAAVIFVAQLFGNLLQRVAAHTQFKDLHILFAERGLELIHQRLRYHCFLHILRRVRLHVFLSAVGVGIGLLKFLQRDYRVLGAGVVPFSDKVRFLIAFTKIKVLKAGVLPWDLDDLVHPMLFHHIGHNVAQIDVDLPFRHIP